MSKVPAFSGGTAPANQLWTANQSCWVRVPSIQATDIFIQAGVTSVMTASPLYQNTSSAIWSPHLVDQF